MGGNITGWNFLGGNFPGGGGLLEPIEIGIILKIYVINFPIYICHEFEVQKQSPVVFFK